MTDQNDTERVSVRVPVGLLEQINERVERGEYRTRSDAIRAALRRIAIERSHVGTER